MQTVVKVYSSRREAESDMPRWKSLGWSVSDFKVNNKQQGWSFFKTCCLGAIFLPLALLGKKSDESEYIVTYVHN
jgi:hypothetical protein